MSAFADFDRRLGKINRKHVQLAHGYTSVVGRDGLIVLKPRRRRRSFPIKGLALLVVGFFGFKGLLLAHLGEGTYNERIAGLNSGTLVEQSGALLMTADPLTEMIAAKIWPLLH